MTVAFTIQRTSLLDATAGMSDCVTEVVGAALIYVAARSFRKVITTAGAVARIYIRAYTCNTHDDVRSHRARAHEGVFAMAV
jgi:hypothetical protein